MNKIKITRAGGYDPKLGPKHPANRDPALEDNSLVESTFHGDKLTRTIKINAGNDGRVTITERESDDNVLHVGSAVGHATVTLDSTQLWEFAVAIVEGLYGGTVLNRDQAHDRAAGLRDKIFDVLVDNESRCLDDNIDRDVVLAELVKALS